MSCSITIGVVGNGFVGKATQIYARAANVGCLVFDIDPTKCIPPRTTYADLVCNCDLIFICVPTPMDAESGQCDTSIVRQTVEALKESCTTNAQNPVIIVRSTVPPQTCSLLGVCHMPEFLTEANWEFDFIHTKRWHLGIDNSEVQAKAIKYMAALLKICKTSGVIESDHLCVHETCVTETAKYFRNAMLAARIGVCNEYAQYCNLIGLNYNVVREILIEDPRIGSAHTSVPGPDGRNGFGGTCLPKDLSGLICAMRSAGMEPVVLNAIQTRNNDIDRKNKEWLLSIGRSVSHKH